MTGRREVLSTCGFPGRELGGGGGGESKKEDSWVFAVYKFLEAETELDRTRGRAGVEVVDVTTV